MNDRATISYRIPESLRARIEAAAAREGLNLTQMITRCVERSLDADVVAETVRAALRQEFARRDAGLFDTTSLAVYPDRGVVVVVDRDIFDKSMTICARPL